MERLATHIWVSSYLLRLTQMGIYAHIAHHGDDTAGAVAVKLATMNGKASLYTRASGPDGRFLWHPLAEAQPEPEVDEMVRRRRRIDPDLWVVEVEDPRGRHMLGEPGIAE